MTKPRTGDVNLALSTKQAALLAEAIDAFRQKHLRVLNQIAFLTHSHMPVPPKLYAKRAALEDAMSLRLQLQTKIGKFNRATALARQG